MFSGYTLWVPGKSNFEHLLALNTPLSQILDMPLSLLLWKFPGLLQSLIRGRPDELMAEHLQAGGQAL